MLHTYKAALGYTFYTMLGPSLITATAHYMLLPSAIKLPEAPHYMQNVKFHFTAPLCGSFTITLALQLLLQFVRKFPFLFSTAT